MRFVVALFQLTRGVTRAWAHWRRERRRGAARRRLTKYSATRYR